MKRLFYNPTNRFLYLLVFVLILAQNSCQEEKDNKAYISSKTNNKQKKDSLKIAILLPSKQSIILNLRINLLDYSKELSFYNNANKDSVIIKKIKKEDFPFEIYYGIVFKEKNNFIENYSYYLVGKGTTKLNFALKEFKLILKENNDSVKITKSLYDEYNNFCLIKDKSKKSTQNLKIDLDIIYKKYSKKYKHSESLLILNNYFFLKSLQNIDPYDSRIDDFFKKINKPIIPSLPLQNFLYEYVSHNLSNLNFPQLNYKNYNNSYIDLLTIGVFSYLRENKNDSNFLSAYNWLKTTSIYANNSIMIDLELTPLNKEKFEKSLKNLTLYSTNLKKRKLQKILEDNPSEYYLIDFWATWCAPCIDGINKIKKLNIPENIKIINLSVDKLGIKNKWKEKSNELKISPSYLLDSIKKNKEFLQMINLNSIPRYIILDKNLNLINSDFFHPSEPTFIKELEKLK